ncbi:MAG: dynamin family protein [Filomicrobium sp.]
MTEAMRALVDLLSDVRSKLQGSGVSQRSEAHQILEAALNRLEQTLARRPTILVAGESNSGKTSVANLLAGLDALPSAVVANTSVPVRLRHGKEPAVMARTADGAVSLSLASNDDALPRFLHSGMQSIEIEWPTMLGNNFELLDTPPWPISPQLIRDADILLWCSVAPRPWTESERQAIAGLPLRLRERSILVVTHKDALPMSDQAKVMDRYREHAQELVSAIVMIDSTEHKSKATFDDLEPFVEELSKSLSAELGESPLVGDPAEAPDTSSLQSLRDALEPLLEAYWDHRALTGRRLCRHLAQALTPVISGAKDVGADASSASEPGYGPDAAILANIASRLSTA